MTKVKDDYEAVRVIVSALEGFGAADQERIIRWAREKLGLISATADAIQVPPPSHPPEQQQQLGHAQAKPKSDIKTFVTTKNPKNDMHFAATIAYFYRFEAPEDKRKSEINGEDLQEATRQASRNRLKNPGQTLINAHSRGLLDKGNSGGAYSINAVGENLVAMTLPLGGDGKAKTDGHSRKRSLKTASAAARALTKRKKSPTDQKAFRGAVKRSAK